MTKHPQMTKADRRKIGTGWCLKSTETAHDGRAEITPSPEKAVAIAGSSPATQVRCPSPTAEGISTLTKFILKKQEMNFSAIHTESSPASGNCGKRQNTLFYLPSK
jgi:hypothetical protein